MRPLLYERPASRVAETAGVLARHPGLARGRAHPAGVRLAGVGAVAAHAAARGARHPRAPAGRGRGRARLRRRMDPRPAGGRAGGAHLPQPELALLREPRRRGLPRGAAAARGGGAPLRPATTAAISTGTGWRSRSRMTTRRRSAGCRTFGWRRSQRRGHTRASGAPRELRRPHAALHRDTRLPAERAGHRVVRQARVAVRAGAASRCPADDRRARRRPRGARARPGGRSRGGRPRARPRPLVRGRHRGDRAGAVRGRHAARRRWRRCPPSEPSYRRGWGSRGSAWKRGARRWWRTNPRRSGGRSARCCGTGSGAGSSASAGRRLVEERFDWRVLGERLAAELEQLAARRS